MDIDLGGPRWTLHRSAQRVLRAQGEQGQLQSYSYSQWCPAVTQPMNLTRDLSDILNRVLHIENSILNRILLVRRMENQHVEADVVYMNRGDSSEFEYRDENPSPPPPPLSQ